MRFIITGMPGVGKSSCLSILKSLGLSAVPETATDFMLEDQARGILRPWENFHFPDRCLLLQLERSL